MPSSTPPLSLDRPLSIPLLVGGSLMSGFIMWPLSFAGLSLFLGIYGLVNSTDRAGDAVVAGIFFGGAGVGFLLAGVAALWVSRRRRWLEVTLTGFVLCDRQGRHTVLDNTVQGLKRGWRGRKQHRQRKVILAVEEPGGRKRMSLVYAVPEGAVDPLAGLWDRVERDLARRVLERANESDGLTGRFWRLTAGHLISTRPRGRHPLSAITRIGTFDNCLCIWIGEEETAWLRLPVDGPNVGALLRFLENRVPSPPPPLPGRRLGRRLFVRRSQGWWTAMILWVIGLLLLAPLAGIGLGYEDQWPSLVLVAFIPGVLLLFGGLAWLPMIGRSWLAVHENGVVGSRGRILHCEEMGALTWKVRLIIEAWPSLRLPPVVLRQPPADEEMLAVRNQWAAVIAVKLHQSLAEGQAIDWTHRSRFLPEGLECQSKRRTTMRIPFAALRWVITAQEIVFFAANDPTPICSEAADVRNFFPIVHLLDRLRARPEATPPTPPVAPETRITISSSEAQRPPESRVQTPPRISE